MAKAGSAGTLVGDAVGVDESALAKLVAFPQRIAASKMQIIDLPRNLDFVTLRSLLVGNS
jgi:hypothetical protein